MAVCALAGGVALAQMMKDEVAGNFRVPEYDREGNLKSQLLGESARMISKDMVEVSNFKIELFKDGQIETRVTAPHCVYNLRTKNALSPHSVRIMRGDAVITGTSFSYDAAYQRFVIETNAKVVLRNARKNIKDAKVVP